jgi:hypothetical protein
MSVLIAAAAEKTTRIISLGDLKYKDIENSCKTILSDNGEIIYFPNNNAILVESTENNIKRMEFFIKHAQEELKKKAASQSQDVPNYKVIPLGNVEYGTVESNCRSWLSPNGKMVYSIVNNAVIVTDTPKVIAAIEKFITELAKATPEPVYDNIRYLNPGDNDSSTVIIYSGWLDNGWIYSGRYRPWRPYPHRPYPPPRPPRPPRPPYPPGPPPPPVPVPVPIPHPEPGSRPTPNLRPGDIQRRPDNSPAPRPETGPRRGGAGDRSGSAGDRSGSAGDRSGSAGDRGGGRR